MGIGETNCLAFTPCSPPKKQPQAQKRCKAQGNNCQQLIVIVMKEEELQAPRHAMNINANAMGNAASHHSLHVCGNALHRLRYLLQD